MHFRVLLVVRPERGFGFSGLIKIIKQRIPFMVFNKDSTSDRLLVNPVQLIGLCGEKYTVYLLPSLLDIFLFQTVL